MNFSDTLRGKRVVVTRSAQQGESFVSQLEALGAIPVHIPVIRMLPAKDPEMVQKAVSSLKSYDWVVFSSANGVRFFVESIKDPESLESLRACRLAAVGPATGEVLEKLVRKPDAMPGEFVSDAITADLGDVKGKKILLARAAQARKVLAEELIKSGAEVTDLALYDVVTSISPELEGFVAKLEIPDFLTFTSSSTVRGFRELLERSGKNWLNTVPSVCIGPVTAKTLRGYGVEPYAVASVYTVEGMLEVLSRS